MPEFIWTEEKQLAAQLVAERNLSYVDIAARCDVSRVTLHQWRCNPEFQARVKELFDEYKKQVLSVGIANRIKRVEAQNDRWNRLNLIIKEREADPEFGIGPGGSSGVMARKVRKIEIEIKDDSSGARKSSTKEIIELEVDATLLREIARVEDMVARELGQEGVITEIPEDLGDLPDETLSDLTGR